MLKLSTLRRTMARRMTEVAQVPCFYIRSAADVTALFEARAALVAAGQKEVPTVNDYVVRAAALCLREHPEINSSYVDGTIQQFPRINVGVALAVEGGLVVAAVYDADLKPASQIHADVRDLAALAERRELGLEVMSDATFTISNLGMFGIEDFDPLLNPPQAAILGVGAALTTPDRRRVMRLTMGCDHRVLTGVEGAVFLAAVKACLEEPERLA